MKVALEEVDQEAKKKSKPKSSNNLVDFANLI